MWTVILLRPDKTVWLDHDRLTVSGSTWQRREIFLIRHPSAAHSHGLACTTCRCDNDEDAAMRIASALGRGQQRQGRSSLDRHDRVMPTHLVDISPAVAVAV